MDRPRVVMLTIVELGPVAPARIEGLRALLDALDAESAAALGVSEGVKWVLLQPGPGQWTEARGYELIIEHVEVPRWSLRTPALALPHPRRLLDLVHLYRPSAIVCRSPLLAPLAAGFAGLRLRPRPARLCTWVDEPEPLAPRVKRVGQLAPSAWARIEGLERGWSRAGLRSFDAVLVAHAHALEDVRARGVPSVYHVPRGVDRRCFHPLSIGAELGRAPHEGGAREPKGPPRVFVDLGCGVSLAQLEALERALCRELPRDPIMCVHAPGRREEGELQRDLAGRARLEVCPVGEPEARAQLLRRSELALVIPGVDDGREGAAEAMACGCPVIAAGGAGRMVEAAGAGRGVARGPDMIAGIARLAEQQLRGGRARSQPAVAVPDQIDCLLRELGSIVHVIEALRGEGQARPGSHRLEPPARAILAGPRAGPGST